MDENHIWETRPVEESWPAMDNPILNGELHCNEKEIWSKMTNRQYSIMTSRELSVFFENAPDAMIHSWPQMYSKIYKMFTVHIFWLNPSWIVGWWPVRENKLLTFHYSGIRALGLDGIVGWWIRCVTCKWKTSPKQVPILLQSQTTHHTGTLTLNGRHRTR